MPMIKACWKTHFMARISQEDIHVGFLRFKERKELKSWLWLRKTYVVKTKVIYLIILQASDN